jgi:hypothetical protein
MESRDILNHLGQVIGQLELPSGTAEEVWAERLAFFAKAPETAPIPDVTPRQIRQALVLSGVNMEQIEAALDSLPEPTRSLAKIEWEYSIAFQRNRPLVAQVGTMLGWTSAQIDDLWALARGL